MMKPLDYNLARTAAAAKAWDRLCRDTRLTDDELSRLFAEASPIIQDDVLLKEMIAELE